MFGRYFDVVYFHTYISKIYIYIKVKIYIYIFIYLKRYNIYIYVCVCVCLLAWCRFGKAAHWAARRFKILFIFTVYLKDANAYIDPLI